MLPANRSSHVGMTDVFPTCCIEPLCLTRQRSTTSPLDYLFHRGLSASLLEPTRRVSFVICSKMLSSVGTVGESLIASEAAHPRVPSRSTVRLLSRRGDSSASSVGDRGRNTPILGIVGSLGCCLGRTGTPALDGPLFPIDQHVAGIEAALAKEAIFEHFDIV